MVAVAEEEAEEAVEVAAAVETEEAAVVVVLVRLVLLVPAEALGLVGDHPTRVLVPGPTLLLGQRDPRPDLIPVPQQ